MRMKSVLFLLAAVAALSAPAVSLQTNAFPRVWMSLQWGPGMEAKVADLAAHGVEAIVSPCAPGASIADIRMMSMR